MNYRKYIGCVLSTFLLIKIINVESQARTCTILGDDPGCCTFSECGPWTNICFAPSDVVPTTCPAPEGMCNCALGYPGYCNEAIVGYCGALHTIHQCDMCCCNIGGGDDDDPEPNNWYGVYGRVWSDFNNNGTRDEGEDWKGLPQYDTDGRCAPTTHQQDFSVIVNGENIARAWWCVGTPRIHTTRFEYYSHHDGAPGWVGLNAGMSRGNYYTATLGNMPSGSSCGTWTVYNSDGSLQGNGAGCNASFLFTTVNNYMVIDWKLGPAGCTSDADCNDNLFCTDDVCDIPTGQCTNPVKTCNDSNACTADRCDEPTDLCVNTPVPVDGTLGPWGSCSGGSQTSTCNDFSCGGSCSAECTTKGGTYNSSTNICTRPCLYVEGNIWSDDNGNTVKDNFEKWRDSTYLSGCSTPKVHPSFILNYTGETGNQIKGWWCHVTAGAYYRGSTGVAANIEPGQSHTFTLSNWPDGYKPKAWVYNHPGYSTSGNWSGFGPFSTSSITMPASGWTNVHWELQQQKYNLTIKVKDIPPETLVEYSGDSCTLNLSVLDNLSDATVIISSTIGAELCNKTTDSNGEVTCDIWVNQGDLNITVRKRVSDEEIIRTYSMVCPSKSNSFIYNPGDVADGDSKTELVGLQESYKESWVSAVDSDIFANEVDVTIPLGIGSNPAGYVKALLNSFDNITGGFVFSNDQVLSPSENTEDEGTIYNLLFEDDLGGRAENLDSGGVNHNSKWLESFTFEAPANATEISNFTASLDSGVIYKGSGITTLPTTYALSGTGVAVLYIDNDLTINNDFTTSSNGRLLLVVNGSVTISKDVGTDVGSFMLSQDPNIEAGIIASGKIEFESIGGSIAEDSHDDPIMVSAPLITRDLTDGIIFSRDLYTDNNVTTPAESAKAFNKYLYLLSSLEREKSQDNLYFTGLTTFDLDWEYIY